MAALRLSDTSDTREQEVSHHVCLLVDSQLGFKMKPEQEVRRLLRRSSRFNHQVPNSSSQLDVKQITEHQNQFVFPGPSCKDVSVRQSTFLKGESAERGGAES